MHTTPDNILVKQILQGNKYAFDSLFFKYYKPLYRFAYHICNSSTISEESVQNTFIKIWKNYENLNPTQEIGKLLFTYTKNGVIDEVRKQNTRKRYEGSVTTEFEINESNFSHDQNMEKAIIESAIDQLPEKAKEIFRMAKQEGLTNKEISGYLKISVKTVENQLTISYKKLKKSLEPYKNLLRF